MVPLCGNLNPKVKLLLMLCSCDIWLGGSSHAIILVKVDVLLGVVSKENGT